jgi:hypothetical protein
MVILIARLNLVPLDHPRPVFAGSDIAGHGQLCHILLHRDRVISSFALSVVRAAHTPLSLQLPCRLAQRAFAYRLAGLAPAH